MASFVAGRKSHLEPAGRSAQLRGFQRFYVCLPQKSLTSPPFLRRCIPGRCVAVWDVTAFFFVRTIPFFLPSLRAPRASRLCAPGRNKRQRPTQRKGEGVSQCASARGERLAGREGGTEAEGARTVRDPAGTSGCRGLAQTDQAVSHYRRLVSLARVRRSVSVSVRSLIHSLPFASQSRFPVGSFAHSVLRVLVSAGRSHSSTRSALVRFLRSTLAQQFAILSVGCR